MNWIQIDKIILNLLNAHKDKENLYADVKKQFKWNDSQTKVAVEPLITRTNWYENSVKIEKTKSTRKKKS